MIMKKQIWLVAGITGMLLGHPAADARAAINVQINTGGHPSFVINSAPNFIYLRSQGFSVSIGNPYDMVYYGDFYYIYYNSHWYRSSSYHGPWILILNNRIPYQIRRHRWEDIRRYRDIEYRRSDHNSNKYQRNDDNRRRILDQRNESGNRRIQEQQNRAVENRRVKAQPIKPAENRRVQEQPNRPVENRRVPEKLNKPAENRRVQEQPNRPVENRRVQEKPNRPAENRRVQEKPNKPAENRRVQEQPKKGADNKRTQEEQSKGGNNNDRQNNGGKRN